MQKSTSKGSIKNSIFSLFSNSNPFRKLVNKGYWDGHMKCMEKLVITSHSQKKTAHCTVYHHLSDLWAVFIQLDCWLRWWYRVKWASSVFIPTMIHQKYSHRLNFESTKRWRKLSSIWLVRSNLTTLQLLVDSYFPNMNATCILNQVMIQSKSQSDDFVLSWQAILYKDCSTLKWPYSCLSSSESA